MGTSINQRSPDTTNWRAVQTAYSDMSIPVERVIQEIWRAATNQPEGNLANLLGDPIIARLREIVIQGGSPLEIGGAVNREIVSSKQSSLATDIARRAAIQCAQAPDRAQAFSERLFVEASNYLMSRDLPGQVGLGNRTKTVADTLKFKTDVLGTTAMRVREGDYPSSSAPEEWRSHVTTTVKRLSGKSD